MGDNFCRRMLNLPLKSELSDKRLCQNTWAVIVSLKKLDSFLCQQLPARGGQDLHATPVRSLIVLATVMGWMASLCSNISSMGTTHVHCFCFN